MRYIFLALFLTGCASISSSPSDDYRATEVGSDVQDSKFLEELSKKNPTVDVAENAFHESAPVAKSSTQKKSLFPGNPLQKKSTSVDLDKEILESDLDSNAAVDHHIKHSTVPVEINHAVQKWITYFTEKDRKRFARYLKRSGKYEPSIKAILREEGVPEDLFYIVMIESGFATRARSHAGAVGPWQFMRGTARRYKLTMNRYVDERRDPWKATRAAASYLRGLYKAFGSWYLALSSYNAGENRTLGAILRADSRDFWYLAEQKRLPRETMNYIPKYIAARIIATHPERYGFDPNDMDPPLEWVEFPVKGSRKLSDIARIAGIPHSELKALNPEILRGVTPNYKRAYNLRLPAEYKENLVAKIDAVPRVRLPKMASSGPGGTHRVRRGESLWMIAKKYGVNVKALARANRLRYPYKIYPRQKLNIPGQQVAKKGTYIVRSGDSLYKIAKRYGVSVSKLKRWNKLSSSRLYPGQKLRILAGG